MCERCESKIQLWHIFLSYYNNVSFYLVTTFNFPLLKKNKVWKSEQILFVIAAAVGWIEY